MGKKLNIFLIPVLMSILFGCSSINQEKEKITEITFSFWEPGTAHELEDALQEVAKGYEELNPDVDIKLISEPVESYQDMIKSKMISDELPDIQSNHTEKIIAQYNAGLIVNIGDKLNSKSSYEPKKNWSDCFESKYVDDSSKGRFIPFFGTEIGIYYNKDIYKKLGLSVPETWSEFINNCEVIEKSGVLPISFMAQKDDACMWLKWSVSGGLFARKHLEDKNININNDSTISTYETFRAIMLGKVDYSTDVEYKNEYKEYIKYMSQFLKYCGGYPGFEETVAKAMFLSGETAHILTGSWDANGILKNNNINFETGVFRFPVFTKKESAYAGKKMQLMSSQTIGVTKSVYKEEGKFEKVIDFLQYFTSNDVYQEFINKTSQIPVVEGVEFAPGTEVFDFEYDEDVFCHDLLLLKDEDNAIIHQILSGKTPVFNQSFFEERQRRTKVYAERYAENNNLSAENDYYMEEYPKGVNLNEQ